MRLHTLYFLAAFIIANFSIYVDTPLFADVPAPAPTSAVSVDSVGNVVVNPSFEEGGKGWNRFGSAVGSVARSGRAGLTVTNSAAPPQWNGADQVIVLPAGAASITVSGWIKTEDVVRGREEWENARISIEFRDEFGKLVGGYPPVAGQAVGNTDWTHYSRTYRVSSAAQTVVLQCALGRAMGAAHFDDITLTIRNRRGELLESGRLSGITDEGEWYTLQVKSGVTGSHYVNWSGLLDAPAGKHGFLTVRDGGLYFENGVPARFWGTNIVAQDCFASDAQIDSAVSRLAKMGVNMVRLHHMDAPWAVPNIFGNTPGTRRFSESSMRQLDYLIWRAKEAGIYIFLDLLVHRDFTEADGIENRPPELGGKQVGFFSKDIIALQKEYNENLLNHVNQFTGTAYKDEPAIAMSAFINESTVFGAFAGDILTPPYREELEKLWNEWLDRQPDSVKHLPAFADAVPSALTPKSADSAAVGLDTEPAEQVSMPLERARSVSAEPEAIDPEQLPEPVLIKLASFGLDWSGWQSKRPRLMLRSADEGVDVRQSIKFLSEIEAGYFNDMREHFRGVGSRYPLAGSNMPLPLLAMLRNNATLDIIASNDYWDHPDVWKIDNDWDRILEAPFHNHSQLKNLPAGAIQSKSYYRIADKPFMITEWNHCYPNEYVLEGVPLMAAYGALQGWDGLLQFDFNLHTLGVDRILNYKLSIQPEHVALWVMAAPLFLRGDVRAAPGIIVEGITEEQYGTIPNYSDIFDRNYHLPFVTRVAKRFDADGSGNISDFDKYYDRESGIIRSETGELMVDGKKGYMRIDVPRVQGTAGFIGGEPLDFPLFSARVANRHASIYAVSADGADLTASKRFYLVVTGPAKMQGQVYDPARNVLENAGEGDVLMQVVNGSITFNRTGAGKKLRIFPLESDGSRGKAMKMKRNRGTLGTFELDKGRTPVYEVVVR